ncbi:MAG: hypothetical protein EP347_07315 [Alphaproteobacteria bacterium]|nr:MAG: hypothetical protein EP347_07315 [Alphaproteobacteria bacterium]
MKFFTQFDAWQGLIFVISLLFTFGILNGLYSVSRLIRRGGLPVHLWILNGFLAVLIALSIAERSH